MCCPPPAPGGPVVPPAQSRGCLRRNGRSSPGTPDFGQEERPVRLGPEEGSTGQTMVLSWGGGGQHRTTQVYTQVERLTRPDLKKKKNPVPMVIFIPYSSSKWFFFRKNKSRPFLLAEWRTRNLRKSNFKICLQNRRGVRFNRDLCVSVRCMNAF